jgi:hypothetical protein
MPMVGAISSHTGGLRWASVGASAYAITVRMLKMNAIIAAVCIFPLRGSSLCTILNASFLALRNSQYTTCVE